MKKIMFICTGNICRSAMAHVIFEKLVKEENKDIQVFSSGIFAQNGDMAPTNARLVVSQYNVDLLKHRATNIKHSKIKDMDIILCMTEAHKFTVIKMFPRLKDRVFTLREYINNQDEKKDIKDPWGYSLDTYNNCVIEIKECLDELIKIV